MESTTKAFEDGQKLKYPQIPWTRKYLPYLMLSPTLIILLGITGFPLLYSLYLASHTVILTNPMLSGWSLWSNIKEVFFETPYFWQSLWVTVQFVVVLVSVEFGLGLLLAVMFEQKFKGKNFIFPFFLLPMMLTPVVVGCIWRYLYNGEFGLIAGILKYIGVENYSILNNPGTAMFGIMIADIWQWTPFMMLLLLAGLRALPQTPFEAAKVDGASTWQIFKDLTIPLLKQVIMVALLLRIIDVFNKLFDVVYIMTGGGPGRDTEILTILAYRSSFQYFFMHHGAIVALFLLIIIIIICKYLISIMKAKEMQQ